MQCFLWSIVSKAGIVKKTKVKICSSSNPPSIVAVSSNRNGGRSLQKATPFLFYTQWKLLHIYSLASLCVSAPSCLGSSRNLFTEIGIGPSFYSWEKGVSF